MNIKNILLIAQPFAPHSGSHATRINGLVEALLDYGYNVCVLTTTTHSGMVGVDETLVSHVAKAKVLRAFCGPLHFSSYLRNRWKRPADRRRPAGIQWRKAIFVPDSYVEWIPSALVMLGSLWVLRRFKPELIISSSNPYSCHLIGLGAKRLFRVPWVADFGDPWVMEGSVQRGPLRLAFERRLESAVIRKADAITWTTAGALRAYSNLYPAKASAMHVLPMAFRQGDFALAVERRRIPGMAIRLTYAGRVNAEHRDGYKFLEIFAQLKRFGPFRLSVAGTEQETLIDAAAKLGVTDLEVLGDLRHADFIRLLNASDVLVLLGNSSPYQVPGKLFQYLGAAKPILYVKNMSETEEDEVGAILDAAQARHVVVRMGGFDPEQLAHQLVAAINAESSAEHVQCNSWHHRATELMAIAQGAASNC